MVDDARSAILSDDETGGIRRGPYTDPVVSTGSTLLDLALFGLRIRGGGVPGGIVLEIFGPPSTGKTAILVEMAASSQIRGGDIFFNDPEARLDKEYARLYGLALPKDKYERSDTVNEMFNSIWTWKPKSKKKNAINIYCADSLAALSTELELGSKGDKMGMKRAKDFSANLRKTCRLIKKNNWVIACTNQEREGEKGITTPGGRGIPYYASARIRVVPAYPGAKIKKEVNVSNNKDKEVKVETVIGVKSICEVRKSSIDEPYRTAPIYIMFNHGIDDIRANLQYIKDLTGANTYDVFDRKYKGMDRAVAYIEEHNYEKKLRKSVIDIWESVQKKTKVPRKDKVRF